MRGVNKVILVGNLGQDPDVKTLQSGTTIANCSLATSSSWTDSSGQRNEKVEWHRLVMFGRLAEIAGQYLHKGSPVYVEGSLQTRKWEKEGVTMYTTEVNVRDMQMLGRKDDNQGSNRPQYSNDNGYNRKQGDQQTQQEQQLNSQSESQVQFDDFDDDIPF